MVRSQWVCNFAGFLVARLTSINERAGQTCVTTAAKNDLDFVAQSSFIETGDETVQLVDGSPDC